MTMRVFANIWNVDRRPKIRHEELDGREYLVVPMSMILEGVHAGSQGSIYYSKSELSKTPKMWNMKPITVKHPTRGDTATDLSIYKSQAIGMIMGAKWQNGKLKAEAWIDKKKASKVEPEVLKHIQSGIPMEVSTGLFADCVMEEGEWLGEKYVAVAKNIRPDHLAILPDKDGACSIADGAGLLINQATSQDVNNAQTLRKPKEREVKNMTHTISMNEMRQKFQAALREVEPKAWLYDVFPSFILYSIHAEDTVERHYKRDYTINDDGEVVIGETVELVELQTKFVLPDGTFLNAAGDGNVDNSRKQGDVDSPETKRRRALLMEIRRKITDVTQKIYELMRKMEDRKLPKEQYQKLSRELREMEIQLRKHKQSYLEGMRLVDEGNPGYPVRKSGVDSNLQALATLLQREGIKDIGGLVKKIQRL